MSEAECGNVMMGRCSTKSAEVNDRIRGDMLPSAQALELYGAVTHSQLRLACLCHPVPNCCLDVNLRVTLHLLNVERMT